MQKMIQMMIAASLAVVANLAFAHSASAQRVQATLQMPTLALAIQSDSVQRDRPSFVAPLIITAVGFSVGAGSMVAGMFATMGACPGAPVPPPDQERTAVPEPECDHDIPTPLVVSGIAGGAVGLLGAIWLVERLIARGQYNREQRSWSVVPTVGGAQLMGRF